MYVDVKTEPEDYDALGEYLTTRGEYNRKRRIRYVGTRGVVLLVLVIVVALLLKGGASAEQALRMITLYFLLLSAYLVYVYLSTASELKRRVAQAVAEEKAKPSPPRRYSLDEEGISLREDGETRVAGWDTVADVVQADRHIFIFGDREFPGVIPKRAFASEAEAARFYDLAKDYWSRTRLRK